MTFAERISVYNRKRKLQLFLDYIKPTSESTILDIGFTEKEYSKVDNYLEKYYPYRNKVTALGIDPAVKFTERYPDVKTVSYDGNHFPFKDKSFDIGWSNAVLEHVGGSDRQLLFIREIERVTKCCFITTPNKYFPIEIHSRIPFLHYLPKKTFDNFLTFIGKSWCTGDKLNLLSLKKIKKLLHAAQIEDYIILKNKLFCLTLEFVILIGHFIKRASR